MGQSRTYRIDDKLIKDLREAMNVRVAKGLSKLNYKEISDVTATNLVTRTVSWKGVLEELKTKPTKESVFK